MYALLKRLFGVIAAHLHALIDRAENPELIIKRTLRDLETHLVRARQDAIEAAVGEKRLRQELEDHTRQAEEWRQRAGEALRAGRRDIARLALARKQEHDAILHSLSPAWNSAKLATEQLKTQLLTVQGQLSEAKRQQMVLTTRHRAARARQTLEQTLIDLRGLNTPDGPAPVGHAFAEAVDKITTLEITAATLAELGSVDTWHPAASRERAIDNELAELEAQLKLESYTPPEPTFIAESQPAFTVKTSQDLNPWPDTLSGAMNIHTGRSRPQ